MDTATVGLIFRGVERLVAVLAGCGAIYLGYRLFDKAIADASSLEGQYGKWTLKLRRVGPGVLFAALGAVVLITSVLQPFTSDGTTISMAAPQVGANEATRAMETLGSLSLAISLLDKAGGHQELSAEEQATASEMGIKLSSHRDALIDTAFGEGWADKYQDIAHRLRDDPALLAKIDAKDAEKFMAIKNTIGAPQDGAGK